MALRAASHGNLQSLSPATTTTTTTMTPLGDVLYKSLTASSSHLNAAGRPGKGGGGAGLRGGAEEVKGLSRPGRRPIRLVRPVSAAPGSGTFLQINHLHGELVRKRKECDDLKKENKYLSNEIHMERIMMRTENELATRNLRNINHELQTEVKELKQKLYHSQQRATLCQRVAEQAAEERAESEKSRATAEARALGCQRDRDGAEADRSLLNEELELLKKKLADVQLSLAQAERSYFETQLKLDRMSGEKKALLEEHGSTQAERDALRLKQRLLTEKNAQLEEREESSGRRAAVAEEHRTRAGQAQQEAEQKRRLAEKERQEQAAECLSWREKYQAMADVFHAQEDLKSQRQSRACQASIKSYFLCMTESDQRVTNLKNSDGTPRNFTQGDPVHISTSELTPEEAERTSSRTMLQVSAPQSHVGELPVAGGERPDSTPPYRSRKVVEYFWIPTDEE